MQTTTISKTQRIIGWIMSGLVILFMLMDGIMKLVKPAPVVEGTLKLGYAEHHISTIGILGLIATLLYIIPRTALLGAALLMSFFGGAIASNYRLDMPLFSHILFPVYLGILMWGGLWLRNEKLRAVFPVIK
ncbi:MAG: DoxX family protein [Chitinophagaceae bacterium]